MSKKLILTCPVCKNKLFYEDQSLKCINKHTFDFAKEKYVNLYQNQGMNSGDDKSMLLSRKKFLDHGYYQFISNILNEMVKEKIEFKDDVNIVDAGCGEGYYLSALNDELKNSLQHNQLSLYGFDISKIAVQFAAKRNKDIMWFVANSNSIPLESKSIDVFINMFSFYNIDEVQKVIKDNGDVFIFRAGKNHLIELKEVVYDELFLKESDIETKDFIVEKRNYQQQVLISTNEDIQHLLMMTPHYYKTKKENKERINSIDSLVVTLDIDVYILNKS